MVDGVRAGCTGATMQDGTRYLADLHGHMEVDRHDHVQAMLADPTIAGDIIMAGQVVKAKGASCTGCGFGAFAWQASRPCPRCGGVITREESP